uniref:Uncharacterized protein n=1 Tax=Aureoumbra lagunensis TaxID=44058 RepID=A0A7S3JSK4_9STRA
MSGAAANAASRAAFRALTSTAAAAAATSEVAGCRSAEGIVNEDRVITSSPAVVFDGTNSWQLLDENDIAEASAMMAAVGNGVSKKALEVATKMAQRSEVQKAFCEEMGISSQAPQQHQAIEDETASLNRLIDTIQQENDTLRAQSAAAQAALAERLRNQERALEDDCIRLENSLVLVDHDVEEEKFNDLSNIEVLESISVTTEQNEEEAEEEEDEEEDAHPDTSGDEALAQEIADEEIRRLESIRRQELADEIFAKHIANENSKQFVSPPQSEPSSNFSTADDSSKAAMEEEDDDSSILEYALALVGIIIALAITRKFTPALGKKAFLMGSAAIAAISAKFHRA